MNGHPKSAAKLRKHFNTGKLSPLTYFTISAFGLGMLIGLVTGSPETIFDRIIILIQWLLQAFIAIYVLILSHIYLARIPGNLKL